MTPSLILYLTLYSCGPLRHRSSNCSCNQQATELHVWMLLLVIYGMPYWWRFESWNLFLDFVMEESNEKIKVFFSQQDVLNKEKKKDTWSSILRLLVQDITMEVDWWIIETLRYRTYWAWGDGSVVDSTSFSCQGSGSARSSFSWAHMAANNYV